MKNIRLFGIKNHLKLIILLLFIFSNFRAQTCGGTFGNPIFNETFGTVLSPNQIISPPLVAPASTNYQYVSIYPPNDGQYTITNQSGYAPWGFINSLDHTNDASGTYGNMLVVNASYSPGEFYRRRVSNLCSNQFYRFSAWILNLHGAGTNIIKPNVTFQIRTTSGAIIGSVSSGDIAEDSTWKNFSIDFKSDINSNAVDVVLINNSPGGNGNDLAIDDITFSPCGPSTSISADIPNVFTSGICDNSQAFQLTANLSTNTFLNVNYIWQKSSDNGFSWVDLTIPTSNPVVNIAAGSYQNGDQFRFIVGESANILSANCQVISTPITIKINGYPAAPTVSSPLNYCQNSVATSLTATGTNLLWYASATGGTGSTTAPTPNTSVTGTFSFWVSQVVNGCESPRSEIKVNINANPNAPIVSSPINYCQNSVATSLTATGTNLLWYASATGGTGSTTAPTPNTSVTGTFSFWVSQVVNGCESPRSEIKVNINANPNAPIVSSPINYCQNSAASALMATGTNLLWYTSATGGTGSATAPTPNTSVAGTFSFWVSQVVNGCESPRTEIKVLIKATPSAPTVSSPLNYCQNSVATSLTATGTNLLWYTSATGGTGSTTAPTPNTSIAGTFSFWVSQVVNGCESPRTEIKVLIKATPSAPTVSSPINYCQNSAASALTATGTNLLWYTSASGGTGSATAPTPNTSVAGTFSFWVSQVVNGCESPRSEIKVLIKATPSAPIVSSPINYCQNSAASALTATGTNLLWYTSATGGTGSSTTPTPNTSVAGTFSFWVSQVVNGCESPRSEIKVNINANPNAPIVSSAINYCQNSAASALTATGTNLLWYTSATGGTGSATAPTPNTSVAGTFSFWVSQVVNGCESPRSEIKVNINANPNEPIVSSPINYCQNSAASALTATGTNLLWYTSATGGTGSRTAPTPNTSVAGTFSFWVSQVVNGCESPRAEIKVEISPEPHSSTLVDATICNGQTIVLDAGSGFKSYEWNTTPPTFSQTLQVSKVGTYSVILTGNNGCSATQSVNVSAGETPTIVNIISTENAIEIIASGGNPPYSYSIDNQKTWQNSNVFTNLKAGIYTVFVKSQLNSCSISVETAVIFIPNVITPNNDSFNDVFKIKNIEYFPNAKIIIFDRFGKLIFQSSDIKNFTWDGRFLGRILPSGTFYYILDLGNDYKKTGWILLKNRN
ncbi:gliding motility-associated C-terminal domain-containing protein [Halpernia humi]|uniref:Gliding motility-associated C-terminal domain-containing protein n=1 Tax=Halpernia humi TaxID=493375 RepID=A0A1H5XNU1_9FLAO|nr:gliding motility-associated C-terminal domain-containing protein [Halpernia humi]SEG12916.1 gliding motility-associated C-terminal domain-containing protein [Halpernia humi]